MNISGAYQTAKGNYRSLRMRIKHLRNYFFDRAPKILILAYHRVIEDSSFNPLNTIVSRAAFAGHIESLAARFPVISLSSAVKQCAEGSAKSALQLVLTFDDGYEDNFECVFPFLRKKGLPAAFFLPAGHIGAKKPLWDWELMTLIFGRYGIKRVKAGNNVIAQGPLEPRLNFALRVFSAMKALGRDEREKAMVPLRKQAEEDSGFIRRPLPGFLSWEQAKAMSDAGMEIGSHAVSHDSLTSMSFAQACEEVRCSKELTENKGISCRHFAFPFGSRNDFNDGLIACVKGAGYASCLLNIHGYNRAQKDIFCFKRIIMDEMVNLNCLLG